MNISPFASRHPVLAYFLLTYAISFGALLIVVGGPSGISTENTSAPFMALYVATVVGPPVAGIVLTALIYGRAGFRELGSSLLAWRVGIQWWAAALLIGPLSLMVTLFALSFTPLTVTTGLASTNSKLALAAFALVGGLMNGVLEEIGWTGFAVPKMTPMHGVYATGLLVGILWGLWHLPSNSLGTAAAADTVPTALYIAALCFTFIPPFRVLMVWVYEHTKSLLVAILMHASIDSAILLAGYTMTANGIGPSSVIGVARAIWFLAWGVVLWMIVGVVALTNRKRLERSAVGQTR
jgi:membrane protease YdiL (CAAX protease family)